MILRNTVLVLLAVRTLAKLGTPKSSLCPQGLAQRIGSSDEARALLTKPRSPHYTAHGAAGIREQLNKHLTSGPLSFPDYKPCEEFLLEELDSIYAELTSHCHGKSDLLALYPDSDGRSHDANRLTLDSQLQQRLLALNDEAVRQALSSGKCHAIAMAWVHHLTQASRDFFSTEGFVLPLLPETGAAEHVPVLKAKGEHSASSWLESTVTCQVGHEAEPEARVTWTKKDLPTWPSEVTYNASGYGPYPFWTAGGGSGGSLSGAGTDIRVSYSAVQNAEKLEHAACSLSGLGVSDGPCTHLFVNGSWAFLYKQDLSYCCMSSAPEQWTPCHLTRPQRNFMDVMNDDGEIDYTSEDGLYSGKAHKWSMHLTQPSNFFFWYVTTPEGLPLEQGEGPCDMYDSDGSRNCRGGGPKMLFHQYHTSTWGEATLDASVFTVPDICLDAANRKYCMVQPTNFCGG